MTFARVNGAGWTDDTTTVTAAQLNQLDTNVTNAIDGLSGGTYTPSAPVGIGGVAGGVLLTETAGVTSNVQLAARSIVRTHMAVPYIDPTQYSYTSAVWRQTVAQGLIYFPLHFPHGQFLTSLTVRWSGVHYAALAVPPDTPPVITFDWYDKDTGVIAGTANMTDPSVTQAAYEAPHDITIAAINHTINMAGYFYRLNVKGDTDGTGYVAGSLLISISTAVTCTGYTEY